MPHDASFQNFHTGTITDGELVNDLLPNGTTQLKYLVFDCLLLDGNSLMHRTLDKRLAYFRDKVFDPYEELYRRFPEEIQFLPFIVEFKSMEFGYAIEMMFKEVLPNLPHGNDGLIFTCRNSAYRFGTDEQILKWKPEEENSIDFRLNLDFPLRAMDSSEEDDSEDPGADDGQGGMVPDWEAMPIANLSVVANGGVYRHYGTMTMTDTEWEGLKSLGIPLEDTIVECRMDRDGRWRFMRFRDDKNDANHISTVESVIVSIRDRVGRKDLIAAAKTIRDGFKKREKVEEENRRKERQERSRKALESEAGNGESAIAKGVGGSASATAPAASAGAGAASGPDSSLGVNGVTSGESETLNGPSPPAKGKADD